MNNYIVTYLAGNHLDARTDPQYLEIEAFDEEQATETFNTLEPDAVFLNIELDE